tara:strand:+ start:68 stop:259 length:192 start_codon:yes stop_codon:yes gene_type:complete
VAKNNEIKTRGFLSISNLSCQADEELSNLDRVDEKNLSTDPKDGAAVPFEEARERLAIKKLKD